MFMYKLALWGGDLNGAIRFYTNETVAKREAKRFVNRCRKKFGLNDDSYAEIYYKQPHGKFVLIQSIG